MGGSNPEGAYLLFFMHDNEQIWTEWMERVPLLFLDPPLQLLSAKLLKLNLKWKHNA